MIEHQRLGSYERNNVDDIQAALFLENRPYRLTPYALRPAPCALSRFISILALVTDCDLA